MCVYVKINKADNIWMVHFQEPLSKAEEENQEVEVSSAPVARERSDLEDRVRKLENLICEAHRECERKTMVSKKSLTLNCII